MATKAGQCRLRFVPKKWQGPKDFAGHDEDGRFQEVTPPFAWGQRHKWRSIMHLFGQDIDNLELQVFRGGKWKTVETWWEREQPYQFKAEA